jgi:hypothetical protein
MEERWLFPVNLLDEALGEELGHLAGRAAGQI